MKKLLQTIAFKSSVVSCMFIMGVVKDFPLKASGNCSRRVVVCG